MSGKQNHVYKISNFKQWIIQLPPPHSSCVPAYCWGNSQNYVSIKYYIHFTMSNKTHNFASLHSKPANDKH